MSKLNTMVLKVQNKAMAAKQAVVQKITEKKLGGAGTIAALIMIVIVVGILITFKGSIETWASKLNTRIGGALSKFDPTP